MSLTTLVSPIVEGTAAVSVQPWTFMAAFARRVESGLLSARSRYVVIQQEADRLRFRAETWWTAINVGLNDVELNAGTDGRVRYTIRYWRWASYAIVLGAIRFVSRGGGNLTA